MKHDIYSNISITDDYSIFEFLSIGPKGVIVKRIEFMPTEYPDVYNLAFGDVDINDEINDYSISDNKDRNKVLATVVHVIDTYLDEYPHRMVFFTGSTKERTRLYSIAIGINHNDLSLKFDIYSQTDTGICLFQKNISAKGFLIKRKA